MPHAHLNALLLLMLLPLLQQDTDTAGQKLGGALLNAIVFAAVIAGMTFILFLLFKWGVSGAATQVSSNQQQQQQTLAAAPAISRQRERQTVGGKREEACNGSMLSTAVTAGAFKSE